jgi:Ca-activated chloride channel family protein
MKWWRLLVVSVYALGLIGLFLWAWNRAGRVAANLWWTPDQQGSRLFAEGTFLEASGRFRDVDWKGAALYRAGDFEAAASTFGFRESAESMFNRGNALVMLGRYGEAIDSYDRALAKRPDWREAVENRDIALARRELLAPPDDDHGGTGGQLEADEIVIGDRPVKSGSDETETHEDKGSVLSDQEIRAMWLRRVETRPADFLRVKFAYQLAEEDGGGAGKP